MNPSISHGLAVVTVGMCSAAFAHGAFDVPASDPAIVYEGRCAIDADGTVRLGFPGVTAHLRFRGDALSLKVRAGFDPLYFDVSVDGGPYVPLRIHGGDGVYPLVTAGGGTAHTVTLVRRNESWQGGITIQGFVLAADGAMLAPPPLPTRKLMFIGDSVTCGELTAYQTGRDFHDRENANARLSYGMVLAHRLFAQCELVSCGGQGLIRDWQGNRAANTAPRFYELALPDDPAARWDPRRYVPDAIGIQLGTNDFSQGVPDQNDYVDAYVAFVHRIQRDAPHAFIFLMESPMLDDDATRGPRRTVLRFYLDQIVARIASPQVVVAPLQHRPGVPGNTHPTGAEHAAMADELAPLLQKALGWTEAAP